MTYRFYHLISLMRVSEGYRLVRDVLISTVTKLLTCPPTRVPVVWHLNRSAALPLHRVTSEGSLVLLHVEHSAQGDYSCYDSQGLLLHSVRLRLGRKCWLNLELIHFKCSATGLQLLKNTQNPPCVLTPIGFHLRHSLAHYLDNSA